MPYGDGPVAASLASGGFDPDEDEEDLVMGWEVDVALPGAVSESALLGGTPVAEEGEAFLDCLLEVGASEPSFDDVAAVGSEGLSVPAGCGWDFGAMITGAARVPFSKEGWEAQKERFDGDEAPTLSFPAGAAR